MHLNLKKWNEKEVQQCDQSSVMTATAAAAPLVEVVWSGVGGGPASPAPPAAGSAAAPGSAPAGWPHRGAAVGGEAAPEEFLSWNKRKSRRHGRFRRTSNRTVPKTQNCFCQGAEEIETALVGQVHTIFAQNLFESGQFFRRSRGDVSNATQCVGHPEPANALQTHQRSLQNFPKVQNCLQERGSEALVTQVRWVIPVVATGSEHMSWKGRIYDHEKIFGSEKERFQRID